MKENDQKAFKKLTLFASREPHVIRMSLVLDALKADFVCIWRVGNLGSPVNAAFPNLSGPDVILLSRKKNTLDSENKQK